MYAHLRSFTDKFLAYQELQTFLHQRESFQYTPSPYGLNSRRMNLFDVHVYTLNTLAAG